MEPSDLEDGEGAETRTIRPAAIIPEAAAHAILNGMTENSVHSGGLWLAEASRWVRYDAPWTEPVEHGRTVRLGTVRVAYGMPTKYQITLFQVTLTPAGVTSGLTPDDLADEALSMGGLTLSVCPRATVAAPPKPFRF